jgi:hypothetical protein
VPPNTSCRFAPRRRGFFLRSLLIHLGPTVDTSGTTGPPNQGEVCLRRGSPPADPRPQPIPGIPGFREDALKLGGRAVPSVERLVAARPLLCGSFLVRLASPPTVTGPSVLEAVPSWLPLWHGFFLCVGRLPRVAYLGAFLWVRWRVILLPPAAPNRPAGRRRASLRRRSAAFLLLRHA